jgi:hypothetical protein
VRRVAPNVQAPKGPVNPEPYLDHGKFDGKKPEGASK